MSRRTAINVFQNVFTPHANHALEDDIIGAEKKSTSALALTTVNLDFSEFKYHSLLLGSDNITLNAVVTGLKPGEVCLLQITQDATGARTVTWGTGIKTTHVVSNTTNDVDMLLGVFDGTNIYFGTIAKITV